MVEVISAAVTGLCAIAVAIVSYMATKASHSMEQAAKRNEARAEIRREESQLMLEMVDADMRLTVACANALTGGHNNGNVEEAYRRVTNAQEKYDNFARKIVARQVAKI